MKVYAFVLATIVTLAVAAPTPASPEDKIAGAADCAAGAAKVATGVCS